MREKIIIEKGRAQRDYWRDIWKYRELIYTLSWRDITARYKQTEMGALWGIARPLVSMLVFTLVLNKWGKIQAGVDAPYALLIYIGLLPWNLFTSAMSGAGNSLFSNSALLTKVYFPRLIIPISSILTSLMDFLVSILVLIMIYGWFRFAPDWRILCLPFFIILSVLLASGLGFLIASITVKYRDLKHLVAFIIQMGLYISPVSYNSNIVPEQWRWLYILNPLTGIIEGFRWCLLAGKHPFNWDSTVAAIIITIAFLMLGTSRFKSYERGFADII